MVKVELNFDRRIYAFVAAYILVSTLGMYYTPLFDEDEGFFAEAARQMLASGDYVSISVNGEQRYDKPALFFWFTAISLKIFGLNELGARLPSYIFFLLSLFLMFRFVKRHFSDRIAFLSLVVAICMLQFQVLSRAAVSDNLLNLLVSGALFYFYDYSKSKSRMSLFWLYTLAGFGFITKGPLAFVIIFGVIFLFLLISKNFGLFRKTLNPLLIIWAVFIPFPWFYLAYLKSGDFLFTDFFIKHNLGRFSQTMESHGGFWWYYFPVILLSFIPFGHLLFSGLRKIKIDDKNIFLMIWAALPFVLFSFSKTQLPHYISIGYFPLIILISQTKNLNFNAIYIQMTFMVLLFLLAPTLIKHLEIKDVNVNLMLKKTSLIFDTKYIWIMLTMFVLINMLHFTKKQTILGSLIIYSLAVSFFMYKYGLLQQGFVKETGLKLRNSKTEIFMKDHYNPSLSFYARRVFNIKREFKKEDKIFQKIEKKYPIKSTVIETKNGF
ncbi:MAG TPA: glycosyltransferase family 39 protein [Leadbetterella sp.]|nr:glycosyltransferase family 39 protein [Leadbetterella sp.]